VDADVSRSAQQNAGKKRSPPNAGKGRAKGVPNVITKDVRKAVALIAERNVGKVEGWLARGAKKNPLHAADIFMRMLEYHIPKLGRVEHTGKDGEALTIQIVRYGNDSPSQ
jgi:hypothetical protein